MKKSKTILILVLGSMIGIMVLISTFYIVSRTKAVTKSFPSPSGQNVVAQEKEKEKVTLPPKTLEDILANKVGGAFSANNYDKTAVEAKLDQMPKDLSNDQTYAFMLNLVGENYTSFKDTFDSLENPDYSQKMLTLDPNTPIATTGTKLKIEVVLDCSGSMEDPVTGGVKMDLAKQAIQSFVSKLPQGTLVGLRVFGHKGSGAEKDKAYSASQTELVYPFSAYNEATFSSALKTFNPTGWTAIAGALTEAGKDLSPKEENIKKVIYLVTDGIETCGGDPVSTAKTLHESDIQASINIIGFDVDDAAQKQLQAASTAGGGTYVTVKNEQELKKAFQVEMDSLLKLNSAWVEQATKQITAVFDKETSTISKMYVSMSTINSAEKQRLWDAANYLYVQKQITNDQVLVLWDWESTRWNLIYKYTNEKYSIINKMLKENSESYAEIFAKSNENTDSITGKK
ncbi:MAG TPA: VWA domain-containing protein [Desulfosporosinus sp.]|nr:VWA domain-containing protein [Desulfosporosinus sp.]